MPELLNHVEYLMWCAKAVSAANREWQRRHCNRGLVLMDRGGLHFHLFRWCIETGRIKDPGRRLKHPHSHYVAKVWYRDPDSIKDEARRYWRQRVEASA